MKGAFVIACVGCVCVASADQTVRTLDRLPNDAVVFSERVPNTSRVSVQLWLSAKGTEETPETNGWRHLIEHFMAKRLDNFTDENGIFLSAETTREAMAFKFEAPGEKLSFCLEGVRRLFDPLVLDQAAIDHEIQLIRHEEAGLGVARRFSRAGWSLVFEGSRPDPIGDFEAMARSTPELLRASQTRMLAGDRVVLSACGAVPPSTVSQAIGPFLGSLLRSADLGPMDGGGRLMSPGKVGTQTSPSVVGSALCVKIEGVDRATSLARLAVGFAATQSNPDVQALYTVSTHQGLFTLATSRPNVAELVDALSDRQLAAAPGLLEAWLDGIEHNPTALASFRGALLSEGSGLTLDSVMKAAETVTLDGVRRAKTEVLAGLKVEGFR